jgi:DNA-binding response OmpR family regulator
MNKNVLITDDDEDLCEELTEIFENEGFRVDVAHSGNTARGLIEKNQYQIVILDLKLPGMRGLEVLKVIKGHGPEQKVIILSGQLLKRGVLYPFHNTIDEDEVILHTADAVMHKPVNVEDLLDKVKELLPSENGEKGAEV